MTLFKIKNIKINLFLMILSVFFCAGILKSAVFAQLESSSWPMFGNNPQHTGLSTFAADNEGEKVWEFIAAEGIDNRSYRSAPAVAADGTIYFGATTGESFKLYALAQNGAVKWVFEERDCTYGCQYSSPAVSADGTIYINTSKGLYAVRSNGTLKWVAGILPYTGCNELSSPAIALDGTIYVGGGALYAVNPEGGIKWIFRDLLRVCSSPGVDSLGTIYAADYFGGDGLYAINQDGSLKWKYATDNYWFVSSPAIGPDGTIYIGVDYPRDIGLLAINENGTLKWNFPIADNIGAGASVSSTVAIASDGTIYLNSSDSSGDLYALNPNGKIKWIFSRGSGIGGDRTHPAIGSNGIIYASATNGKLFAISPEGGANWSYKFPSTLNTPSPGSPIIGSDGLIYVVSNKLIFDPADKFIYILYAFGNLPKVYFTADIVSGGAPLTVRFIDQSKGTINNWRWDFGDGTNSTDQNPTHTYNRPGRYNVTLRVSGSDGSDIALKKDFISVYAKNTQLIPLLLLDN
jgi:outer membrane protein assembly factor BamB